MVSYDLEKKTKKGKWIKFRTFFELNDFATYCLSRSFGQNNFKLGTQYRIIKVEIIRTIIAIDTF